MRMSPLWGVPKANELSSLARNEHRARSKRERRRLSERNRIPPGVLSEIGYPSGVTDFLIVLPCRSEPTVAVGKPPRTSSGGNLVGGFLNRSKRAPQCGVALTEVAEFESQSMWSLNTRPGGTGFPCCFFLPMLQFSHVEPIFLMAEEGFCLFSGVACPARTAFALVLFLVYMFSVKEHFQHLTPRRNRE